jgi:structural maintenance of chromosome 3 (chondroitin sulfate proteoglycan 6)
LLNQFKAEKKNLDIVEGYHGLLIDNIECDKSLFTAVETAVGGRLFYHVVDSDVIVMRLLKLFNQNKMPGDVNYFPLNVLKLENVTYPETQDAISLISKIKYDDKVKKAIHSVFDRVLLCRNAEIATQLAKQTKMDCVLLDGDLTSRKGALTGGYVDTRQSKLSYYRQKNELSEQIKKKEAELENIRKEIRQVCEIQAGLADIKLREKLCFGNSFLRFIVDNKYDSNEEFIKCSKYLYEKKVINQSRLHLI